MRLFDQDDYAMIHSWCSRRDSLVPPLWALPPTGIIVKDIAVGFLIMTDNNCGMLDFYITNPEKTSLERDLALDEITKALIEAAIECELKMIMCNSQVKSIVWRAKKHGFNEIGDFATLKMEL